MKVSRQEVANLEGNLVGRRRRKEVVNVEYNVHVKLVVVEQTEVCVEWLKANLLHHWNYRQELVERSLLQSVECSPQATDLLALRETMWLLHEHLHPLRHMGVEEGSVEVEGMEFKAANGAPKGSTAQRGVARVAEVTIIQHGSSGVGAEQIGQVLPVRNEILDAPVSLIGPLPLRPRLAPNRRFVLGGV
ncbi:hypothetical protein CONLIGDRAFT_638707 [Coniochaeta ligniaria NRRL 30616]|uniref:Uncharacterized protein n=1 Tax=Coniochaeta ligniaria NRRL 30616 TaxID=1408157 RepID=A0A1J7JW98_9PEZI|nr:hypothetical protein CONLIGDRAFT_638707 [Coniochaeta ligniaria NRRL 30616]